MVVIFVCDDNTKLLSNASVQNFASLLNDVINARTFLTVASSISYTEHFLLPCEVCMTILYRFKTKRYFYLWFSYAVD